MEETAQTTGHLTFSRIMAYVMLLFIGMSAVSTAVLPVQYAYADETGETDGEEETDDEEKKDDSSSSSSSSSAGGDVASSAKFSDIGSAASRYWQNAHAADIEGESTGEDDDDSDSALSAITSWFNTLFNGSKKNDNGEYEGSSKAYSVDDLTKTLGWTGSGVFLVFQSSDVDTAGSIVGLFASNTSNSAQTMSYSTVGAIDPQLNMYTHYGRALSLLGLDHVETNATSTGAVVTRYILGSAMYISYALCNFLTGVFQLAVTFMRTFNPFSWFVSAWQSVAGSKEIASGLSQDNLAGTVLASVQGTIRQWYTALYDMGLLVSTLVLCIGIGLSLMAFAKSDKNVNRKRTVGSTVKDFIKRLFFITMIFPLCGVAFSAALDCVSEDQSAFTAGNDVVCSTLIDFESWVTNNALALPDGVTIQMHNVGTGKDIKSGDLDMTATTPARTCARLINQQNGYGSTKSASDLIAKYISGSHISAATYESQWKNANLVNNSGQIPATKIKRLVKSTQVENWATKNMNMVNYKWIASSGHAGADADTLTYNSSNSSGGLSAMSMYAYLLTEFTDTQVTMYSAPDTSSTMTLPEHVSVNVVGNTWAQQALIMVNSTVIMLVVAIISIFFAFGMATSVIGRGVKLLTSVPFALLGSFKAMAKVVTIGAMLCLEVFGTVFVWAFIIDLFLDVNNIFESWLKDAKGVSTVESALAANGGSTVMVGAPNTNAFDYNNVFSGIGEVTKSFHDSNAALAMSLVFLVLSLVFNLWFMFKMIKLRKSILKVMDEFAASIIDRFFTPAQAERDPSMRTNAGKQLAGAPTVGDKLGAGVKQAGSAVVSGAGMAAGMAMTNKGAGALAEKLGVGGKVEPAKDVIGEDGAENRTVSSENNVLGIEGADRQALPDGSEAPGQAEGGIESAEGAQSTADNRTVSADTTQTDPGQAETDALVHRAVGDTTLAQDDAADEKKSKARTEQLKKTVEGVGEAAVGTGKAVAGAYTGNAELAIEGASQAADGVGQVASAKKEADAQVAEVNQQQADAGRAAQDASLKGASTEEAHRAAVSADRAPTTGQRNQPASGENGIPAVVPGAGDKTLGQVAPGAHAAPSTHTENVISAPGVSAQEMPAVPTSNYSSSSSRTASVTNMAARSNTSHSHQSTSVQSPRAHGGPSQQGSQGQRDQRRGLNGGKTQQMQTSPGANRRSMPQQTSPGANRRSMPQQTSPGANRRSMPQQTQQTPGRIAGTKPGAPTGGRIDPQKASELAGLVRKGVKK